MTPVLKQQQSGDSSQIVDTEISCSHFTCRVFATWIKKIGLAKTTLNPLIIPFKASDQLIYSS